uniref:Uncharacterized protein n=1 Tax=Acrobeloides nanus TaxID=290746 RepID=A0A914EAT4_9BILA
MFLLSVIDMIALPCDSFISGIQGLLGQHYCTNPILWYLVGCVGYLGATMACILLAIDRFFEITFPKLATRLFGGNMVYLWMMIPLAYMGFTMTQIPAFYSIKSQAFYYDPYYATPGFEGNPYMLFQSMAICVELFVVAVVYVGNQFYPVPELVVKIEHLTWISVHGN